MINGVHHVCLTVENAQRAAQFYADAANFQPAPQADIALQLATGSQARDIAGAALLRGPNAYLRLLEHTGSQVRRSVPRPVAEAGIVHVCLQSPDITNLYGRFKAVGATFHAPPVNLGTGFLYSYARDEEGNVVELEGVAPVWADPSPWLAHVSFSSHDIDRLATFYANLLGNPATRSPRLGPHPRFDAVSGMEDTEFQGAWIACGNMQVEIFQYYQPPTVANTEPRSIGDLGYSYVCFEVTDIVAARAHFLQLGATQSSDLAAISSAHRFFCSDPDGNILMLLQLAAAELGHGIAALSDAAITTRMAAQTTVLCDQKTTKAI